ncbi:MAG: uroporphyrinogen decarboxylase family protein [Anaerolineae bacterium]
MAQRQAWEGLGEAPDWIWAQQKFPASAWLAQCVVRREGDRLWRVHLPSGQREELTAPRVPDDSTTDIWQQPTPQTRSEVDRLIPAITTAGLLEEGTLALARNIVTEMGLQYFVYGKLSAPFWTSYSLLGFDGLMTLPRENPALFDYMLERQLARALETARAYAEIGVHGVFVEECLTSADIISPAMYDRFVYPSDQILLREFRRLGLPVIFYMTGDVIPRLERISELAPAALVVEESKKGFRLDLAEVAARLGERMAVFGNLDATQVKDWGDEEMSARIREQVVAARPARGFVTGIGSPFPLDTPRDRVTALIRIARQVNGGVDDGE